MSENVTVSIIRGGNTYHLNDYLKIYRLMGVGPCPVKRLTEKGPLQHGNTDKGFRLKPRTIRMLAYFHNYSNYWNRRTELVEIFTPTSDNLILRFDLANGKRLHIKGNCLGFPMDTMPSKPGYQTIAIDIECNNPTFFDPTAKTFTFPVSYSGKPLTVPLTVPMGVGSSELDQTTTITYNGSFLSYPHLIRIDGPVTDLIITNESTGEKLDFTGYTIADGDYYEIDLRYNYKTVVDSTGTRKISELTTDSDLSTWHLAAHPEVTDGLNTINVVGDSIGDNTGVLLQYYERQNGF